MLDTPNPMPNLDPATEAALRASIERHGVIVPVVRDQHGRLLDGHHRARIAGELGVEVPEITRTVDSDDEARGLAVTLNTDRRHLMVEQRRDIVADLRQQGHSLRAIAGAVGVSKSQVERDVSRSGHLTVVGDQDGNSETGDAQEAPAKILGRDGKEYPAEKPRVGRSRWELYAPALAEQQRGQEESTEAPAPGDGKQRTAAGSRARGQYNRLANVVGMCQALTDALPDMKVNAVAKAIGPQEINALADIIREAANVLLAFERRLRAATDEKAASQQPR